MPGQIPYRALVAGVTNSVQCEVSTVDPHPFLSGQEVRFTNLNGGVPSPMGMDQINNYRYVVVSTGLNTFKIIDPITLEFVDSTNFVPWISGGNINLIQQNFYYHRFL
jgi:hypothetical protein